MTSIFEPKKMLAVLAGQAADRPPIWMMRQAGRYLPEYRELRASTPDFLSFCYNPQKASEATLQPLRRFNLDAAIIFSDILVIPDALGQKVRFEVGEGPRLEPLVTPDDMKRLHPEVNLRLLGPVYEAIDRTKSQLDGSVALIGFAGAPWTIASYMIAGRGSPDQMAARLFAYRHPDDFARLIDLLVLSITEHLVRQVQAGAEIVQIFDSWAGVLPYGEFEKWCLSPLERILREFKARCPFAPVIAFPRACNNKALKAVSEIAGVAGLSIDTSGDLGWASDSLPKTIAIQGNLDPIQLLAGGSGLDSSIDQILSATKGRSHIFNLGHGILPPTPVEHVERLIKRVRG